MDNKAIKDLIKDKLKAKAKNDFKELIKICNCLGKKYLTHQRYSEAIDEHRQELEYSFNIHCLLSEAIARRGLGECYSETNEYKKALSEHKKYLSLSQRLNNDIEIQRAFATIGRTHLIHAQEVYGSDSKTKDNNVLLYAKNAFLKALELCNDLSELKDKELAEMRSKLFHNLGLVFEIMDDFTESMTHFHYAIDLNKKYGLNEDLFKSQLSLAAVYEKHKELEMASNTYDEAIRTAKTLKNKTYFCDVFVAKGLVLMRRQRYEESRKMFKKAFRMQSPIGEDHQKAIRFLKISSVICEDLRKLSKSKSLDERIGLCDRLGDHFVELKLFEIAIDFYKQELNFGIQSDKSDAEIGKIYVSIAQTYADDLQYEEAIKYFKHDLHCNRGNGIEESNSLINIAEMMEFLEKEVLNDDIIDTYETAIQKIGTKDKTVLTDILQRYMAFLKIRDIRPEKVLELKERLKELSLQKTTECQRVVDNEDNEDIYDNYDIKNISDLSSDSDEDNTSPRGRRVRRVKKPKLNEKGETCLHTACIKGNTNRVRKLLEDKHPVNVRDLGGWTPLHEAANLGHLEIIKLLVENGADINANEGSVALGVTPLIDACNNGQFDVIRFLLKKGAKTAILTTTNETALDCLRDWKQRVIEVQCVTEWELKDCELLEKELEEVLRKEGFVKNNLPILPSKPRRKIVVPNIRNRELSPDYSSDDCLNTSVICKRNSRPICHKSIDFNENFDIDAPGVGRKFYNSTISDLKRKDSQNKAKSGHSLSVRPKAKQLSPFVTESVVNDDWIENDLNDSRKRSCLDAYDAFTKRTKTSDNSKHQTIRRTNKCNQNKTQTQDSDNESVVMSSDNEMKCDLEIIEPKVHSIDKQNTETNRKTIETQIGFKTHLKSIQLRVCVLDTEKTLLVIPILDRTCNCFWLNKEVTKRYFAKFGVKPVLSLQTTDGALMSDEDCILDVITGDDLKVNAVIESWVLDPLHDRYKEICVSIGVKPMDDIINELQMTQINGCLKLSDINLPEVQIKPLFRALQRQNNLREIDISCSNIIFEGAECVLNCLPLLPALQVLNLKCTSFSPQNIEELLSKSCLNLVELNLSFNTFGDNCCEVLSKLLKNFSKLSFIDLSACDLSDKVIQSKHFNDCIKNSDLRSLVLDYNSIESEIIEKFKKL